MTASHILALLFKFNPQMVFSDSPNGFFGGLKEVFDQIAGEEELACRRDKIDPIIYPSFGCENSDFEEVVRPFYTAWNSFSTKKSFFWRDVHRYSEAPDRRIRRLMEKENKRLREEAIREYNDAVRSLVVFVKKRDPRYRSNPQSEAERQRMLRESAAMQAARSRAANQARIQEHVIPAWAKTEEPDEGCYSSSESELEQFECVVCNKIFKSEKQFEAHERSKKHVKGVRQLRWEMKIQDEELHLDAKDLRSSPGIEQDLDAFTISTVNPKDALDSPTDVDVGSVLSSPETPSGNQSVPNSEDQDGDYDTREAVERRMSTCVHQIQQSLDSPKASDQFSSISTSDHSDSKSPKMGKAKQKRAKKALRMTSTETSQLTCTSCHASFPSRTQLFSHIRDQNHARPAQKSQNGQGLRRRQP
jgi:DnaJ family protein A protein 5